MRPIDADKLHYKRVWIYDIQGGELRGTKSAVVVFADEIDKNKKVRLNDVAPIVYGEWKINSDGYYPYCSRCNEEPPGRCMTKYCPNCGAKMDKT